MMATYEILDDHNHVINTIIADLEFVDAAYPGHYREVIPPIIVSIPASVTPFQAKVALNNAGLLSLVESAVKSADMTTQLAWSSAIEFQRNSPLIEGIAKGLGWTDQQLDDLFVAASKIN